MPSRYVYEIAANALRLRREFRSDSPTERPERGKAGTIGGGSTFGTQVDWKRGEVERWSPESRRRMRFRFAALPWEMLGERPVMVTLTYPAEWRDWCPNSDAMRSHVGAFKRRWAKEFGEVPIGVWVVEFQPRPTRPLRQQQAPHIHLYVGMPTCIEPEGFEVLRRRTLRRRSEERRLGAAAARANTPAISGQFGGALRKMWHQAVVHPNGVGVDRQGVCRPCPESNHQARGVDVAVAFFNDQAAKAQEPVKIADYFWRESGKWAQKEAAKDFGGLRYWGCWGERQGFRAQITEAEAEDAEFFRLRRVVGRFVRGEIAKARASQVERRELGIRAQELAPARVRVYRDYRTGQVVRRRRKVRRDGKLYRGRDGLTAFGLSRDASLRLLAWARWDQATGP